MHFSTRERSFMVQTYIRTRSVQETKNRFRHTFPNRNPPTLMTIRYNYNKYITHGTSLNRNPKHSGRHRTGRSARNIAAVQQELQRNPSASAHRHNAPISKSTFNRIVKNDLHYYPYRVLTQHALEPGDPARRINFCQWLIGRGGRFLIKVLIGDEASFSMDGKVNTWNTREYAPKNQPPGTRYNVPNDKRKIMVWVGLLGDNTIIGPYIFQQNVNGQTYLDMINNFVVPQLAAKYGHGRNGSIRQIWWFQDGAPAHRARVVHNRLQQLFPNRVVGLGHTVEWPPRSPDLTPCDYFLWGYIKDQVYKTVPPTLAVLQQRIQCEIRMLHRNRMTRCSIHAMASRCRRCVAAQGAQIR